MARWPAKRIAQIGIGLLLLILARSLGEYFRLKHFYGESTALLRFKPFIGGCLVATLGVSLAFVLYVAGRYKSTIGLCAVTTIGLLIYKIVVIG